MKKEKLTHTNFAIQDTIISLIITTSNDADIIEHILEEINDNLRDLKINYEILVVDNNSADETINKIRQLHKKIPYIRVLILSKPYDTEIALTAGLDSCIGDYAILFNIYTDPPKMIKIITSLFIENYDIIIGKSKEPIVTYDPMSRLFLKILEKLSTHNFTYHTNYLVGLSRKAVNSIIRTRRKSRNFSYINYLIGFKKYFLDYTPIRKYIYKFKKENFLSVFFTVADIIISNSYKPIRLFTILGVTASILFLLYVFIISIIYFFFNKNIAPQGWISIATVMGFMFFLLFSLLTFISEYVIRTLHETRDEPLYFVSDEIDKSVILTKQDKVNVV